MSSESTLPESEVVSGSQVREHLEFLNSRTRDTPQGWAYASPLSLVLSLAQPEVSAELDVTGYAAGEPSQCFWNARQAAMEHPELLYVEGWAQAMFLPTPHAWCVHRETGRVIDPTWVRLRHRGELVGAPTYLGVAFETAFVAAVPANDEHTSLIHSDWARGHRMLRDGFRMSAEHSPGLGSPDRVVIDWATGTR